MKELFTLLNSKSDVEFDASYWLHVFEEIPDSAFQNGEYQPSQSVISALKQYARAYVACGDEGVVLN